MRNIKILIKNFINLFFFFYRNLSLNSKELILLKNKNFSQIFHNQEFNYNYIQDYNNYIDKLNLPENAGGINIGDQKAIYFLTKFFKPKTILELGTHIGCSMINFLLASKKDESFSQMVTVDIIDVNDAKISNWKKYSSNYSPKQLSENINMSNKINFKKNLTKNFLKNSNQKFDLIFIDAGHSFNKAYEDIFLSLKILNKNGVIILHDVYEKKHFNLKNPNLNGPYLALKKVLNHFNNINIFPLLTLPWKTKGDSFETSLVVIKLL